MRGPQTTQQVVVFNMHTDIVKNVQTVSMHLLNFRVRERLHNLHSDGLLNLSVIKPTATSYLHQPKPTRPS